MRLWGQKTSQYHCHCIPMISRYWYWYQVTCGIVITTSLILHTNDITILILISIHLRYCLLSGRESTESARVSFVSPLLSQKNLIQNCWSVFFKIKKKVYTRPNGSKTKDWITEGVFYIFPMNWRKKFALRGSSLVSTEVALRLPTTNDNQSHLIPSKMPL